MYSISEEWPDFDHEHMRDSNLFTHRKFWNLRESEVDYLPLSFSREDTGELIAFFCFAQWNNEWKTPYLAPYFYPYVKKESLLPEILNLLISYLKNKKHLTISITLAPLFLLNEKRMLIDLINAGFTIAEVEVTSYLVVKTGISFIQHIVNRRKKRRLKSLLGSELSIKEISNEGWSQYYQQLVGWRKIKGHQNLISTEFMDDAKIELPENFRGLVLNDTYQTLCLAIFIKVNSTCFYVYSLITNPDYPKENFPLLLWNALYEIAQRENIPFIEMGTSMKKEGLLNKGLLRYKVSVGGRMSKKYTVQC
ncbi:hypothetical protein C9994_02240 [Marivirga lumbricoides]|uniref:BioF2-like acetyltransferase domain-containing protein n=1 Tax=Marivirga lumbricoides TaxID=1046115 RepID=A0A2T4DUV2_9BACT|nr:hypothetical protein C9994_02240 [Marivirga lumbricoides]